MALRNFMTAALVAAAMALVATACTETQDEYQHGEVQFGVDPYDVSDPNLVGIDLPPLPDEPDVVAPADGETPIEDTVQGPDGSGPDVQQPPADVTDPPPEPRTGAVTLTYDGDADSVHLAGTMFTGPGGDWNADKKPMTHDGTRWTIDVAAAAGSLAPGNYAYKFVVEPAPYNDGNPWIEDPRNPRRMYVDGVQNSKLQVPDTSVPLIALESLDKDAAAGTIEIWLSIADGVGAPGIDPASVTVTMNGEAIEIGGGAADYHEAAQRIHVRAAGLDVPAKYGFRVNAANSAGAAEELFLPVWLETEEFRWEDATLYFLFVDRFANGDTSNDSKATCDMGTVWDAADWHGGDWAGALERLESGWFDELGVNAIWITAPQDNPSSCGWGTMPGKLYSSYHGYHPKSQRDPEEHFGTMEEFKALVDAAHARGIRVLVDAVINHVHDEHPWANQDDSYFHQPLNGDVESLICGTGCQPEGGNDGCWNIAPVQCWFTSYLPDLNFQVDEITERVTDDLIWWVKETNLDGFRVDAVKHVEDTLVWELRAELRDKIETTGDEFYTVGETFTSDVNLLNRYISPDMLRGQFDFPLYYAIGSAFANHTSSLTDLRGALEAAQSNYGDYALMSNFMCNHDVVRFLSSARGDDGNPENPARPIGDDTNLLARSKSAFAFLLTIPGIPMIYYGDEVGLTGVADPDNRKMMQFDGLTSGQQSLLDFVRTVGQARGESLALRRGDVRVIRADQDHIAYARYDAESGDGAIVAINRSTGGGWTETLAVADAGFQDGQVLRNVFGGEVTVSGGSVQVDVPSAIDGGAVILIAQ